MRRNLTTLVLLGLAMSAIAAAAPPAHPAPPATNPYVAAQTPAMADTRIDELVFADLKRLGIQPAAVCSDAVFVRRVYLDTIGTLPTMQETRKFLEDTNPRKRALLIDALLERDEFADYGALRWSDLLRVKSEFPINLWPNAVQAYHHWIRDSVKENKPFDHFARELITASGSNFRVPEANFYRALQGRKTQAIAQNVALTFMGCRAEKWAPEKLAAMAGFFSQVGYKSTAEWKEEIVYFDRAKPSPGTTGTLPDGSTVKLTPGKDPREVFADWLITPNNPWFKRAIANRVWFWLMGRGIVHEPDDIRPDNPATNPELLAYLEGELVKSKFDLKHLQRIILNSRTYQLASIPASTSPLAESHFAYYPVRRLEAEVLIDAICQITDTHEKYSSPIPEPFTFIPEEQRSIALADGSISSSFLELFGRSARDTGLELERNNGATAAQRLHLLNSSHIQRKIEQGSGVRGLASSTKSPRELTNRIYLTVLSRYPTDAEVKTVEAYADSGVATGRQIAVDLTWALINSPEFLYRH